LGGALGGVFVGLIAPHIFSGFWEFWLAATACFILFPVLLFRERDSWLERSELWVPLAIVLYGWLVAVRIDVTELLRWQVWLVGTIATVSLLYGMIVISKRSPANGEIKPAARITRVVLVACVVIASFTLLSYTFGIDQHKVWTERNFYGVLAVVMTDEEDHNSSRLLRRYSLIHGRTVHGFQIDDPGYRQIPTLYYASPTGIGIAFRNHSRRLSSDPSQRNLNVGLIGLGVGTISAYAEANDKFRYYELNDAVTRLAEGKKGFFSFLTLSPAPVTVVPGDARISLERELEAGKRQKFDICVLDAFNSDAIPTHLLTMQAMELYLAHLRDEHSILAIHASNQSVDLVPVVATLAQHFRLQMKDIVTQRGLPVDWILLSRDAKFFSRPEVMAAKGEITTRRVPLWTDDYSNVFQILR